MPNQIYNIHEAKTHLSRLIQRVEAGETITIARSGKPMAILTPIPAPSTRTPGRFTGQIHWEADFDAPLSDEELALWEGQ